MKIKKLHLLLIAVLLVTTVFGCGEKPPAVDPYAEVPVTYTKLNAQYEDSSLNLFFDHSFGRTVQTSTVSTNRDTYKMYMGKNEVENGQFVLASAAKKENLSVSLSDFTAEGGAVVPTELFKMYYFPVDGQIVPDAMVPYANGAAFTVEVGQSQTFMFAARTQANTPAGEYEAQLLIKNAAGQEVKKAKLFLHVWDFAIAESVNASVTADLSGYAIASITGLNLYKNYYEFMLDYRVNPYSLPYAFLNQDGTLNEQNLPYLNNPKVKSFRLRYDEQNNYKVAEILSAHPEWEEKVFYYDVDEPLNDAHIQKIGEYGRLLQSAFANYSADYNYVSPFFVAGVEQATQRDYVDYMSDYINVWCPKPSMYTTKEEYMNVSGAIEPFFSDWREEEFGTFYEYMQKQKAEGDKLWWYTCWDPTSPYITLNTEEKGVHSRILFWQQRYFNIEGFLYWSVNAWSGDGWNSNNSVNSENNPVWGDGQLIYCGSMLSKYCDIENLDTAIASQRLTIVRDGVEDFEVLTMLGNIIGEDALRTEISKITSGVVTYSSDNDLFATTRVRLGNMLEALLSE